MFQLYIQLININQHWSFGWKKEKFYSDKKDEGVNKIKAMMEDN